MLGEGDLEKKVLVISIPHFDTRDAIHLRLAEIGQATSEKVESVAKSGGLQGSPAKKRGMVRKLLTAELSEINGPAERILGA